MMAARLGSIERKLDVTSNFLSRLFGEHCAIYDWRFNDGEMYISFEVPAKPVTDYSDLLRKVLPGCDIDYPIIEVSYASLLSSID